MSDQYDRHEDEYRTLIKTKWGEYPHDIRGVVELPSEVLNQGWRMTIAWPSIGAVPPAYAREFARHILAIADEVEIEAKRRGCPLE